MDFKAQLAARFGVEAPAEADAAQEEEAPARDDLLAPDAHLGSAWLRALRAALRTLPRGPDLADRPKLAQARQATDVAVKQLKKAGDKRAASELAGLRDDFMARRDKAAWAALKTRFGELSLSPKAYRALKQGDTDPVAALAALDAADPAALSTMGAARLRELLG